ncbi:hypothetical protein DV702_01225 [Sporosarcina sp. PTS2304]|uniref:hypothetical protein n=1 Tax=Sporosarcina sp. PTS2304 TaxID=2283194 RepID=UPI000E0DEAB0|nr:hypothetical protein [Sporosarcina sp. PTS2304]AXH98447.1 hypothetical protein DV702_01225 [Sporosarcina sp. PTS2304]
MSIQVKSALESDRISHSYPYIELLQAYSENEYKGFYELAQEIEEQVGGALEGASLEYIRYPESASLFHVIEDNFPVFMHMNPTSSEVDYYKLGSLQTCYPYSHTEKPSGIILEDQSYLQIDFTFAHHIKSMKMFLLYSSFHYGRCNSDKEEFYFFRFDKESDFMFRVNTDPEYLNYKPVYHFHGNCDEPHFSVKRFGVIDKLDYIIDLLKINLERIESKTAKAHF